MALPINIDDLINCRVVESERIEFREGWNPERTLRTICAFANDFNNWGGGYIIIGINEKNGRPNLPPVGIEIDSIDKIQRDLLGFCKRIIPDYFPITEQVEYNGKNLLILWCPGGSFRPYKAPDSLGKNPHYFYYIRHLSSTVHPSPEEERELILMSNRIPFDDQINHRSLIRDFDLSTIKVYLNEINSNLENQIAELSIEDIAQRMYIAEGPKEYLKPKNAGLFFFAKDVNRFFPTAKIEIVIFPDESGTTYKEKIFDGPLHNQLKGALAYLNDLLISEKVVKNRDVAESKRFFNYPFIAIEEALCNAVYHKGYDIEAPIEVRVYPSHVDIISFPGPLPPLSKEKLAKMQFIVRQYRNRRIGEFLKELHLTEGRATGIPTIIEALDKNGSPKPIFETDDERTYFMTTIFVHEEFLEKKNAQVKAQVKVQDYPMFTREDIPEYGVQVSEHVGEYVGEHVNHIEKQDVTKINGLRKEYVGEHVSEHVNHINNQDVTEINEFIKEYLGGQDGEHVSEHVRKQVIKILNFCLIERTRKEILGYINLTNVYLNYKRHINTLVNKSFLELTIPDKPKSIKQKYITSADGMKLLKLIEYL